MQIIIYRFYTDNATTTVGKLIISEKIYTYDDIDKLTLAQFTKLDKIFDCFTIELDWKNNQRNISCIPKGRYIVTKHNSPKFKRTLLINNVPNRSGILIHSANRAITELQGCIAPVSRIEIDNQIVGVSSRKALNNILAYDEQIKSILIIDKINHDS